MAVSVPLGRVAALKRRDRPLVPVDQPEIVMVDGWLLDRRDMVAPDAIGAAPPSLVKRGKQ